LADQPQYGVTPKGFVIKGLDTILSELQGRAREMFGSDVDLTSGSPLRKLLDAVAWQGHELWSAMEKQYYANFITTAEGPSLDLLGQDLGLTRGYLSATGQVVWAIGAPEPNRTYVIPEGAIVQTTTGIAFRTLSHAKLSSIAMSQTVNAEAMIPGPTGNVGTGAAGVSVVNPGYIKAYLNLGTATLSVNNLQPFSGGDVRESDSDYRSRLRGNPRSLWTLDRVAATVRDLPGVRDCRVFDPLGGVDVSQSYFNLFRFGQRSFTGEPPLASPYYFDIVVATQPGWPWHTDSGIQGIYEEIVDAIKEMRPVSIFPNILQANQVEVGLRATLFVRPGHDLDDIRQQILVEVRDYVSSLGLGTAVLYSSVLVIARTATGVVDVQDLHLRRCPPQLAAVNFGGALFGHSVEAAVGENLPINADEVAYFNVDAKPIDVQVVNQ